jgi:hypothetical protein
MRLLLAFTRKPTIVDWSVCFIPILLGLGLLYAYAFNRLAGSTPEQDLTLAEGVPVSVELSRLPQRYGNSVQLLEFSIDSFRMEYGSDAPKFREVVSAVTSGKPVRVWVSTKQETLVSRPGFVPLYKLSVGEKPILTYRDVKTHSKTGSRAVLIGGCAVLAIGVIVLVMCIRNYRRHQGPSVASNSW